MSSVNPESMVEQLRAGRLSAKASFLDFALLFNVDSNAIFCFVEGEDGKYYSVRIRNILSDDTKLHFLKAGGKKNVLELHKMVSSRPEYQQAKTMFFVDRDFDDIIGNPVVYETPCYSIENLYVTEDAFSRVLKHEFGLSESEDDYIKCLDLFRQRFWEFHEAVHLLNSWIFCHRRSRSMVPLHLSDIDLNSLVEIHLDNVECHYNLETLRQSFSRTECPDNSAIEAAIHAFRLVDRSKVFRGKFEIEFLRVILLRLQEDAGKKNARRLFSRRHRVSLAVTPANILSALSPYADTPDCLRQYILQSVGR